MYLLEKTDKQRQTDREWETEKKKQKRVQVRIAQVKICHAEVFEMQRVE